MTEFVCGTPCLEARERKRRTVNIPIECDHLQTYVSHPHTYWCRRTPPHLKECIGVCMHCTDKYVTVYKP